MNFLEIDNEASWETDYKADPVLLNEYYDEAWNLRDHTLWHNGRIWQDDRIVVPTGKITAVLDQYHDHLVAGYWESQGLWI